MMSNIQMHIIVIQQNNLISMASSLLPCFDKYMYVIYGTVLQWTII